MAFGLDTAAVAAYQQQQQLANLQASMAPQQQQLATFGVPGSGPVVAGGGASPASNASNNSLSQFLSSYGGGGGGAAPQLQIPNAPTMPNFNASAAAPGGGQYNSQIQQLIAQLQQQASQSDSVLSDRANQQIAAQRSVLDRRANQDVQRSLAQNGLLPTGGLASRMREQISRPYEEQLAASAESINSNLQQQRGATANNLLSSVSGLQNAQTGAAADAQRLQMQAQMNQYQMQMGQYEAQVRASESAYQHAMDAYQMQQQQQQQQMAQQQAAQQRYATQSSGGGGTSYGPSINAGQNSFLDSGVQPRDLYNQMVNDQRASETRNYNQGMAGRANSGYTFTGNTGNGMSSAGSATGISMNGPLVSGSYRAPAQSQQGYGVGSMYPGAYGGSYGNPATDNYMTGGWGA